MSDATKQQLIDHLLRYSVRTGDFTLKSGKKSSWFIDSKQTACRPDGLLLMADLALDLIPDDVTAIGGLWVASNIFSVDVARFLKPERNGGGGGPIFMTGASSGYGSVPR
jgi:orotate phosphoribosyltransferase